MNVFPRNLMVKLLSGDMVYLKKGLQYDFSLLGELQLFFRQLTLKECGFF